MNEHYEHVLRECATRVILLKVACPFTDFAVRPSTLFSVSDMSNEAMEFIAWLNLSSCLK